MVLVVNSKIVDDVMQQLNALGESAFIIGEVDHRAEEEEPVQFEGYFPDRRRE